MLLHLRLEVLTNEATWAENRPRADMPSVLHAGPTALESYGTRRCGRYAEFKIPVGRDPAS